MTIQHPPRRVAEQARRAGLGTVVRRYDPRPQAWIWVALLGTAGGALVVAGLAYRSSAQPLQGWGALLLAVGYLSTALWILWRAILHGRVVYLMENGFVRVHPVEIYAWDELISVTMAGLRRMRRGRTDWRFTVIAADARETVLGRELPDVAELGEIVIAEVTRRVMPWYVRAVRVGGAVSFGPFVVDREGISKDGERVLWAQVSDVAIDNGVVYVSRLGRPAIGAGLAATVGAVPNAVAFTVLCKHVLAWGDGDPLKPGKH